MPRASVRDTLAVAADLVVPLMARGAIVRRPRVVGLEERLDADRRAIQRLQRLRARYGEGPLLLRVLGREVALILSPAHVHRVLLASPDEFTPANREKRAALSHFQPEGVLISQGRTRALRRELNEAALDSESRVHRLGAALVVKVRREAELLLKETGRSGVLDWESFATGWWRIVRSVTFGDGARDDPSVTDALRALRRDANWAYLKPRRNRLRQRFLREVEAQLARAEEGSLAARLASLPSSGERAPEHQVAHWLFAFDAAGMASFPALALIDAHPDHERRVRDEFGSADGDGPRDLPLMRATVLESLRLWPTTPVVLRDAAVETTWESGTLPRGAATVIFAPFFHRDAERAPHPDSFAPELWLDDDLRRGLPLIPFSEGPAVCPGRNLVLLLTTTLLGALLERRRYHQAHARPLAAARPLPATLSPFRLRFSLG